MGVSVWAGAAIPSTRVSSKSFVEDPGRPWGGVSKTYDSRYEDSHGPLPKESDKIIYRLVRCGDPHYGLSLLHCPDCKVHMAVPYSCKTRVCPSCVNRRAEVLAHSQAEKLPEGDYRHQVITLPKKMGLRKRFQLNTGLHRQICLLIHRVLTRWTATSTTTSSSVVEFVSPTAAITRWATRIRLRCSASCAIRFSNHWSPASACSSKRPD